MAGTLLCSHVFYLPCMSNLSSSVFIPVEENDTSEDRQGIDDLYFDNLNVSDSTDDFRDVSDLDFSTIEQNQETLIYQMDVLNTNINNLQTDNQITVGLCFAFIVIFSVQLVYKFMCHVLGLGDM